jgi:hypothetical protein
MIKRAETTLPLFQLRSTTDATIDSVHLSPGGYWLLLYRDLSSSRGDALLTLLDGMAKPAPLAAASSAAARTPLDASKLVIVLRNATGAQLSAMQLNYPDLKQAQWLRDEKNLAAHALKISGAPHLIGGHEGSWRWQLAGSLEDPAMQTTVQTWLRLNRLPKNALVVHKLKMPAKPAPAAAKVASQP